MILYLKRHIRGELPLSVSFLGIGIPWAVFYLAYWGYLRHIALKPYAPFRWMPVVIVAGLALVMWQTVGTIRSAKRERNRTVAVISILAVSAWFIYHFGMLVLLGGLYLVSLR